MRIKQIAEQRGIPHLVHFTRIDNLASIMQYGIIPIADTPSYGMTPLVNDEYRWDGHRNASCLSITHPNHSMFYSVRCNNPQTDWVVLILHPSILWEKSCAFCYHNAADARISGQPLTQHQNHQAFLKMFDEIDTIPSREDQRLQPYDTTDVQAEVLVFGIIEPEYIIGAAFDKEKTKIANENLLPHRQICLQAPGEGMFASRSYIR